MPRHDAETVTPPAQYRRFKTHPLLALFPGPTENDITMMKENVKEVGVTNEIVIWTHPNSSIFLIDGRTRDEAAFRAFQEKVEAGEPPVAANGRPLQPEVFNFEGTLDEVYAYMAKTHIRKHFTPGQKTVMVVRQHYYEYKQAHGARLPSLEDEMTKTDAVSADELARRAGVNTYYPRVVRRLYRDRPDLLDAIALGTIGVAEADRMSKAKGAADEEEPTDAPAPPDDPEVVRDANREEVPENLQEAFRARSSFRVVTQHLEDALHAAAKLAGTEGAVWFDSEMFTGIVQGAAKLMAESMPHIMCDDCEGKGRVRYARADCPRCKGSGYVSKGFIKAEKRAAKSGAGAATEE